MPAATVVFDRHMQAGLRADLDTTLATMVEEPHQINLGSGTGGSGAAGMREFDATNGSASCSLPIGVHPELPDGRAERWVDELVIRFTHSEALGQLPPGAVPSGRRVEMALVAIVGINAGTVACGHMDWDQAGLPARLGLLDPAGLPVDPGVTGRVLACTGKG